MNISQITTALTALAAAIVPETFIFDLLLAYGLPKASVARLKNGNLNLSKIDHQIAWKKKLLFAAPPVTPLGELALTDAPSAALDLHAQIDQLKTSPAAKAHAPRFIIATDFAQLLAYDTKTHDSLDIALADLAKHADFFLPWAGMEKAQAHTENAADVKAAANMAKLYDLITDLNPAPLEATAAEAHAHALNVFLSRLLFCFFAEDTHIFTANQFTTAVESHTQADGSDLAAYLDTLFAVLNTDIKQRASDLPAYLAAFKYVNGGLFKQPHPAPAFNHKSRALLIELGGQDWAQINPDIFGSMIQAVVAPSKRGDLGMHYTSVPNIMKVIGPLFLDELHAEFDAARYEPRKLDALRERISRIKVFDPACGSGNFLITAYKKLCELEIAILNQRLELQKIARSDRGGGLGGNDIAGFALPQGDLIPKAQRTLAEGFQIDMGSRIELSQFYGIEIDDFAHEIATLSLWLAQHQMNVEFKKLFGESNSTLPLAPSGNITHGNACRVDWETACPSAVTDEVYLCGNPPFLGWKNRLPAQTHDMSYAFEGFKLWKPLDLVATWFWKGAQFIAQSKSKALAFVSTNSICQGEQVDLLWTPILSLGCEIQFAHQSFKWSNAAKSNAAVHVVIIGLGVDKKNKKLFKTVGETAHEISVPNISPYLLAGSNTVVRSRTKPLSQFKEMIDGNNYANSQPLMLSDAEKNELLRNEPQAAKWVKKLIGADEFLNDLPRWCLWLVGIDAQEIKAMPLVQARVDAVRQVRLKSRDEGARRLANRAHQFRDTNNPNKYILIPRVTSERREYAPVGYFMDNKTITTNANLMVVDAEVYELSILMSKMHMVWLDIVGGRLKSDYRYSAGIVYNTFPFPDLLDLNKAELEQCAYRILETRERYSEKTLAQLYDPKLMPDDLRAAHRENDLAVERCYRIKPFTSDEERLAYLFSEYERMVADESAQLDLLADEKIAGKVKKTKKPQK